MPYPPQGIPIPPPVPPPSVGGGSQRLKCTITDDILLQDPNLDTEVSTTQTFDILIHQITLNVVGSVRLYLELRVDNPNATAWASVQRNGVGIFGGLLFSSSTTYEAKTLDINDCIEGDVISIYLRVSPSGYTAYMRNVRLLGKVELLTETPIAARRDL